MSQDKKSNHSPFPQDGFVRANQIIGDPDKGIAPFFPVSRSEWYSGIKEGRYPKGIKLSKRVTVWKAEAIRNLVTELTQEAA